MSNREVYCTEKEIFRPAYEVFTCLECRCSRLSVEPDGIMSCHKEEIEERSEAELKPCPFCGSKGVYAHDTQSYEEYGEGYVLCPDCGAQSMWMFKDLGGFQDYEKVLKRTIEAWNRRAAYE